jgi:predicted nucleic acid-binding protein
MRFWDSSALVPLVVREAHSASMRVLVEADPEMIVWWGSHVECASAVHRLRRQGALRPADAALVLTTLAQIVDAAAAIEPGDAVCAKALRLLGVHALRDADALQLAAALLWARDDPAGREFVSLDDRLRDAALLEGFRVIPETA